MKLADLTWPAVAKLKRIVVAGSVFLMAGVCLQASSFDDMWKDPVVEQRIESGIRSNRMGNVVLRFTGADGRLLTNVTVRIEQTRHEFLFGANIFMLGGFPTAEENRKFEKAFTSLLNFATVPFYWSDLEPEAGRPRFAKDSVPIYRRPPPDAVVEFCRRHGLAMKGHPLVWHLWYPKWRPDDPEEAMRRAERRITEIAARYEAPILNWDVVNEPCERDLWAEKWFNLPGDYLVRSFRFAAEAFPARNRMIINEATTYSWLDFKGAESRYYRLIRGLLDAGVRVDCIGMQLHVSSEKKWQSTLGGQMFAPADLFNVLDRYSDFGRPIHITELTFPVLRNTPEGERDQAAVARNFYRLWFSHPRVEAITWWNLVDGTAAKGEDKLNGGLLRRDFSPKPSFEALDRLINHDWKTVLDARSGSRDEVTFRGFHGEYTVTVQTGGQTIKRTFRLKKGANNEWTVTL